MLDLNIALILKFVDQATAPARAALQNIQGASEAVQRFGGQQMAAGRQMVEQANAQTAALRGSTMATLGTGAALVALMQPAIQFEAQMDKVAAVSRANAEEQEALTRAALEQGARTRFSARQAGEGLEYLGMAGFDARAQIAALPGVLDLAAAAGAGLGDTANYATNMLSAFGLPAEQMSRVGDVLVNTFTSSNTDLNSLAATMSYAAPVAKGLGIEIETVAAMAGRLGDQGISGERAGTALRAVLQRLVAPSTEAANALDGLGVNIADADGNMRPMLDVLADMDEAMRGMGQVARENLRSVIFGTEAAGAAAILMEGAGSGALQSYAAGLAETGSAARVAAQMSDNARGSIDRMRSAVEGMQIALGNGLLPVLADMAERLGPIAVTAGQWASENQALVTTIGWIVAGLLGLNIAVLAAQWGFWLLFGWVGKARVALGALIVAVGWIGRTLAVLALRAIPLVQVALMAFANVVFFVARMFVGLGMLLMKNPITLAALAIAAAVYIIYDSWDGIVAYFQDKFDRVKDAFGGSFLGGLRALWAEFNIFTLMMDAVEGVLRYLGEAFNIDLFTQGANMIESLRAGIYSVLTGMVAAVKTYLAGIVPDWLMFAWSYVSGGGALDGNTSAAPSSGSGARRRPSGGRDSGGLVRPGFLYEINERAQEFFSPNLPGSVVRGTDLRGGASGAGRCSVTVGDIHIHLPQGVDPQAVAREVQCALRDVLRQGRHDLHDGALT
ncbi:MAG: phage tail tape measure protein [Rhodobacteraceae bacterium]|nr:phage tail tape measure protein [Paracoccaceae bacterium]